VSTHDVQRPATSIHKQARRRLSQGQSGLVRDQTISYIS